MPPELQELIHAVLAKCQDCGIEASEFLQEKLQELEERKRILLTPSKKWFADNYSDYGRFAREILQRDLKPEELHGPDALSEATQRRFNPERRESFDAGIRRNLLEASSGRCTICGVPLTSENMHVDHILPLAEGGSNHPLNLQAACEPCNLGKSSYFEDTVIAAARPWWESRSSLRQGTLTLSLTKRYCVLVRGESTCISCGRTSQEIELRVIPRVPFHMGGQNVYDNLLTRCTECT